MVRKNQKGITLIALAVSIIVLIILASISMTYVMSNNGILNKAQESVILKSVSEIKEALELVKAPILLRENKVDLDNYLEELDKTEKSYILNYVDRVDENNAYLVANSKYRFLLKDTKNGDVEIIYEGEVAELSLSEYSGIYTYPTSGTFKVTSNVSRGELSVASSNEEIAKATISGDTVTITPGKISGEVKIIVTSAKTEKYEDNKVTYTAKVMNGNIDLQVIPYTGIYDGNEYNACTVSVEPTDCKIEYSLNNSEFSEECPKISNVGKYTISVKASKEGYTTNVVTKTTTEGGAEIQKADGEVILSKNGGGITYNSGNLTFDIVSNKSNGNITVRSENTDIANATISGNTVTVSSGTTSGRTKIIVTSEETENYKEATAEYEVNIFQGISTSEYASFKNYTGYANLLLAAKKKGLSSETSTSFTTGEACTLNLSWVFRGSGDFKLTMWVYVDDVEVAYWESKGNKASKYGDGTASKELGAGTHTIKLKTSCDGSTTYNEYYGACVHSATITY